MAVGEYAPYRNEARYRQPLENGPDGTGAFGNIPIDIQVNPQSGRITYPAAPNEQGEGVAAAAVPMRGQPAEQTVETGANAESTAFSRLARQENSEDRSRRMSMRPTGPV